MPSDGSRPTSIPTALSVTPRAGPRKKAGLRQNFKPTDLSRCCATWHASRWMTCVYRNLLSIDQVENRPTSARNDLAALLLPDPVGLGRSPLSGGTADIEPTSPNVRVVTHGGHGPARNPAAQQSPAVLKCAILFRAEIGCSAAIPLFAF